MIRTVTATRYIHPLREGGSVPAVVEADDGELYVMKFAGAAQGPKALIAELVAGEIARALGLRLPEIVFIELDPILGRSEPHPEIRDLIQASAGLNLALRYLPSAFAYNPLLKPPVDAALASAIVWFDAYVTNVDRTPRSIFITIGATIWNVAGRPLPLFASMCCSRGPAKCAQSMNSCVRALPRRSCSKLQQRFPTTG